MKARTRDTRWAALVRATLPRSARSAAPEAHSARRVLGHSSVNTSEAPSVWIVCFARELGTATGKAGQLAVAADARPFVGPAAEPPRFRATLRVAQPRAEGRARLNCRSVSPSGCHFPAVLVLRYAIVLLVRSRDTSERASALQAQLQRALSPEASVQLALRFSEFAREFAKAALHEQYPELAATEINRLLIRQLHGDVAEQSSERRRIL